MPKDRKKIITELSEEILKDWYGPSGECWCPTQKKFIDPDSCNCPECSSLRAQDIRQFRYLRLHDDYRAM